MTRTSGRSARIALAVTAAAALTGVVGAEAASAHTKAYARKVSFVPAADPGRYEIHVKSVKPGCIRNVPVQLKRGGTIVFANRTNGSGVVVAPANGQPRIFGPEFAGAVVTMSARTSRRGQHKHTCKAVNTPFPGS